MSYDKPGCYLRREQIENDTFNSAKQIIRTASRTHCTPTIVNLDIPNKDTEQSFVFPIGVSKFSIRDRGNSRMRYAYVTGEVQGAPPRQYKQLGVYAIYKENELNSMATRTIYFSSNKDNRRIEITYWV